MAIVKSLTSLIISGVGVYILLHINVLSRALQNLYIRQVEKAQKKKSLALYAYDLEFWKAPFARFIFKLLLIFTGIFLLIFAYFLVFGTIYI